jgi:hypothetical protein
VAELELEISPPPMDELLEELVAELRELGHEPTVVPGSLQLDRFQPLDVVIRLAQDLGEEAINAIVLVAVGWVARVVHARRGRSPNTVKLYGPTDKVLLEVEIEPDEGRLSSRHWITGGERTSPGRRRA